MAAESPATLISERNEFEVALRESEERFRGIFDNAGDAIVLVSPEGRIMMANGAAFQFFGYSEEEFNRLNLRNLVYADDYQLTADLVPRLISGQIPGYTVERRYVRKDGKIVWGRATVSAERDPFGKLKYLIGIISDINARKEAEEALKTAGQYLHTLIEAIPHLVWTSHPDGACEYLNRRWLEYTGTTLQENLGFGWLKHLHPEDAARIKQSWDEAVSTGSPYEVELRLRNARGEYRWHLARAVPVPDPEGHVSKWFGTFTDISEMVEARQTLARSRVELEKLVAQRTAQLQESIGELEAFSYSLSHDMRAPVRAIHSFTQLVLHDSGEKIGPPGTDYLTTVIRSAQRMDRLIQDVLAFTRVSRQDIQMETVEVDQLVRAILLERPELQPPNAEITLEGHLLPMRGHHASITQCLTNLLNNAVKFVAHNVKPRVRLYSEKVGDQVRLWIEDNGIGIAKEKQSQLFDLFHRGHPGAEYEGTGIGLAIVRKAVERMGGQVGLQSEPGQGSRFWIQLPQAVEK